MQTAYPTPVDSLNTSGLGMQRQGTSFISQEYARIKNLFQSYTGLPEADTPNKLATARQLVSSYSALAHAQERVLYPLINKRLPLREGTERQMLYDMMVNDERINRMNVAFLDDHTPTTMTDWNLYDMAVRKFMICYIEHVDKMERMVLQPMAGVFSSNEQDDLYRDYEAALRNAPAHPHTGLFDKAKHAVSDLTGKDQRDIDYQATQVSPAYGGAAAVGTAAAVSGMAYDAERDRDINREYGTHDNRGIIDKAKDKISDVIHRDTHNTTVGEGVLPAHDTQYVPRDTASTEYGTRGITGTEYGTRDTQYGTMGHPNYDTTVGRHEPGLIDKAKMKVEEMKERREEKREEREFRQEMDREREGYVAGGVGYVGQDAGGAGYVGQDAHKPGILEKAKAAVGGMFNKGGKRGDSSDSDREEKVVHFDRDVNPVTGTETVTETKVIRQGSSSSSSSSDDEVKRTSQQQPGLIDKAKMKIEEMKERREDKREEREFRKEMDRERDGYTAGAPVMGAGVEPIAGTVYDTDRTDTGYTAAGTGTGYNTAGTGVGTTTTTTAGYLSPADIGITDAKYGTVGHPDTDINKNIHHTTGITAGRYETEHDHHNPGLIDKAKMKVEEMKERREEKREEREFRKEMDRDERETRREADYGHEGYVSGVPLAMGAIGGERIAEQYAAPAYVKEGEYVEGDYREGRREGIIEKAKDKIHDVMSPNERNIDDKYETGSAAVTTTTTAMPAYEPAIAGTTAGTYGTTTDLPTNAPDYKSNMYGTGYGTDPTYGGTDYVAPVHYDGTEEHHKQGIVDKAKAAVDNALGRGGEHHQHQSHPMTATGPRYGTTATTESDDAYRYGNMDQPLPTTMDPHEEDVRATVVMPDITTTTEEHHKKHGLGSILPFGHKHHDDGTTVTEAHHKKGGLGGMMAPGRATATEGHATVKTI